MDNTVETLEFKALGLQLRSNATDIVAPPLTGVGNEMVKTEGGIRLQIHRVQPQVAVLARSGRNPCVISERQSEHKPQIVVGVAAHQIHSTRSTCPNGGA